MPTAPRLPWGPGPASSSCGRWRRPLSRGPREARAPLGWKSPGCWPLGRRGHAVRGSRWSCTYLCLRCSPVWGISQCGPTQSPTSLPSGLVLGAQAFVCLCPRTCGRSGLCTRSRAGGGGGAFVSLRTPGWSILILHFLKVFELIAVFLKKK